MYVREPEGKALVTVCYFFSVCVLEYDLVV